MADNVPNVTVSPASESQRMKCAIAYVLLWVTGLVMLVLEPHDKLVKFNAIQAIIYGLVLTVLSWVPCIEWVILLVGWLYALYGSYEVYSGREFKIPYIGEFVENNLI
jgi:uncharacterized membrane protein